MTGLDQDQFFFASSAPGLFLLLTSEDVKRALGKIRSIKLHLITLEAKPVNKSSKPFFRNFMEVALCLQSVTVVDR